MDLYFFQLINGLALKNFGLDVLGIFFAQYFEYVLIFCLLLVFVFGFKRYGKTVIAALFSSVLARFVITNLIYLIWARPRPFVENNVNLLLDYAHKAAFPSGHAAFYFALAAVIFLNNKDLGSLFFVGAVLICLARVFVGIHWPSDILAGAIIGIFSGWLMNKISKKFF